MAMVASEKAAVAMVPDRSLPAADPTHRGAPAFYSEVRGAPLFSRVPLDYQWEAAARMAEKLSRSGGDRAQEAAERASKIRLKHYLWDDTK
jgi:hypothetical protein